MVLSLWKQNKNQILNDNPKTEERNDVTIRNGILKNETAENCHFDRVRFHVIFPCHGSELDKCISVLKSHTE